VCADLNILNTASENVNSIPALEVVMEGERACMEENNNNAICTVNKCGECVFIACVSCLFFNAMITKTQTALNTGMAGSLLRHIWAR